MSSRQDDPPGHGKSTPANPARREFVALSTATAVAMGTAAMGGAAQAGDAAHVVERDVVIPMDGAQCDAAYFHPAHGRHPGVLIWTDAFGLRPAFRDMGRRLAAAGYAVLVPNPYYRTAHAPVFGDISQFDFSKESDRARLMPLMDSLKQPGIAEADAQAYLAFLDKQREVDTHKPLGTQGYCMGGPLVVRTCAALPTRVGAGASFHGGGLVTPQPDSPHLLAPKIKAHMYFAVADSDDARDPQAKDTLRAAFEAAHVPVEVELYKGCQHGWCVSDMPTQQGKAIYDQAGAERAWGKLLALYHTALA